MSEKTGRAVGLWADLMKANGTVLALQDRLNKGKKKKERERGTEKVSPT